MKIEAFCDGNWESAHVLVDGIKLDPAPSQRIRNHSPDGFSWGYGGSGPAQLALAILLAAGLDENTATRLYQRFKDEYVAMQPQRYGWVLNIDMDEWVAEHL